jgi:hypothetical protein
MIASDLAESGILAFAFQTVLQLNKKLVCLHHGLYLNYE